MMGIFQFGDFETFLLDCGERLFRYLVYKRMFTPHEIEKKYSDQSEFNDAYYQDTEYIRRWPDGRPMRCDYLSRAFKNLLAKHELPSIRLHDLRHSCASYMLKMGCSMKEVADWLGHADIKTSMNVYAHLDIEAKKSVAERFSSILSI